MMMEMKRLFVVLIFCGMMLPALAQDVKRKPENLTMTLAWIADAGEAKQYVFVINGLVAYKTLDGLKKYLKNLPKDSTLTWAPSCLRMGDEPLLSSKDEMKKFREFCESVGIKFTLVPSG
jgi:hypothetical protein